MDSLEKNRVRDALEILQEVLLGGEISHPEPMTKSRRRSAMAQAAKTAVTLRKLRQKILGPQFSSDPCWDLLLCLYTNWVDESRICVTDLSYETGVPFATVNRWLTALADQAMIGRDGDPTDGRRTWIKLTQLAIDRIEQVLDAQAFGGYCRPNYLPLAAQINQTCAKAIILLRHEDSEVALLKAISLLYQALEVLDNAKLFVQAAKVGEIIDEIEQEISQIVDNSKRV